MYARSIVTGCALLTLSWTAAFGQVRDFQAERLVVDDNNGNKITLQTPAGPITGGTLTIPDPGGPSTFLIANPPGGSQTVYGDFLPGADSAYDLGSNAMQWRNIFLKGNLNVDSVNIGFTSGSVVFAGSTGALAEDNGNFFWDNINNRLGIGNNAPAVALDVTGNIHASGTIQSGASIVIDGTTATRTITSDAAMEIQTTVGNLTIDAAGGTTTVDDALNVTGNVLPTADNTYALGSDANRWANVYANGGSVHIGPTGGQAGNTEMSLGYAPGTGSINVDGGGVEINIGSAITTINGGTNAAATTIGNATNGLDVTILTNSGTNVLINSSPNSGGVQIGDGATTGGISIASGSVMQIESGSGNAVAINTTVAGISATMIGRNLATSTINLNSPNINMQNLPAGSATDNLVTTDGMQIFETSVATLLGGTAWLVGGNTLTSAGSIGTNSDHALNLETNGTTRMTIADNAGGGDVNVLTDLDVDGTTTMDGAFDANAAGNVIGNGANAEQLEVNGINGGAIEVDINGDMDISGTLSVGQVVMGGKLDMNLFGIVNLENLEFNTVASQISNLVGDVTVADNVIINSSGSTDLTITEEGFDRSSGTNETIQINNSGAGSATLVINGGTAPTNSRLTVDDGHWTSQQTTAPVAAVAGANVTSATLANQTDVAGFIDITTSGAPAVGAQATVTFNVAYGTAPIVSVTPANGAGAGVGAYVTRTTTGFTVSFIGLPAAATSYQFFYQVIETQ